MTDNVGAAEWLLLFDMILLGELLVRSFVGWLGSWVVEKKANKQNK
jgi:hypothetical protein